MLCTVVVDDTLDSMLGGSDDEAEEDAVISQVLDEIGIEVTNKVSKFQDIRSTDIQSKCTHKGLEGNAKLYTWSLNNIVSECILVLLREVAALYVFTGNLL